MSAEKFKMYPLTFSPVYKDYVWGGRNLERFGRVLPPDKNIAESWEIAGHEDGTTLVDNGYFSGKKLTQVQAVLGLDLVGRNNIWAHKRGKFPLLVKLLDANQPLSVQVHPDDEYALANEGNELGKTELWVVLHAEPGAQIILGLKAATNPEIFRRAIEANHPAPYLHHLRVKKGDHICVPAGSLHAIMGGMIIAEIQQNSNTTYRVYDWNRLGADGRPRTLHINQALDVINFDQIEPGLCSPTLIEEVSGIRRLGLCQNEYFLTEKVEMIQGASYHGCCTGDSLEIWGAIEGHISINDVELNAVRFALLPASLGDYVVTAVSRATLLRTYMG